jgi:hypothetical protein
VSCFFQNYVDHDASDKVRDYRCGGRSYDGHDGTDIRIRNLEIQRQGVEVARRGAGTRHRGRNDMEDVSVKTAGKAAIAGKECGNGVLIEHRGRLAHPILPHGQGQRPGQAWRSTTTGQPIGHGRAIRRYRILSSSFYGAAWRKDRGSFAYGAPENACGGGRSLWAASLGEQMQYRPREIIDYGFAGIAPTMELIESGEIGKHPVTSASDALVAYVRAIGLQAGDQQFLAVQGPAAPPSRPTTFPRSIATRRSISSSPERSAEKQRGRPAATARRIGDAGWRGSVAKDVRR